MPNKNTHVFVSYSRVDASLVGPVVQLLRVNKSLVFQDIDSISPGTKWRQGIAKGLAESHLVVVFWCDHASSSKEVTKEWKRAIKLKKDLLPLLLDATPLPKELGVFQGIDFQATVGANHKQLADRDECTMGWPVAKKCESIAVPRDAVISAEPAKGTQRPNYRWIGTGVVTMLAALVIGSTFWTISRSIVLSPEPSVNITRDTTATSGIPRTLDEVILTAPGPDQPSSVLVQKAEPQEPLSTPTQIPTSQKWWSEGGMLLGFALLFVIMIGSTIWLSIRTAKRKEPEITKAESREAILEEVVKDISIDGLPDDNPLPTVAHQLAREIEAEIIRRAGSNANVLA